MSKKKPTPEEVVLNPEEQELEDALEAAHADGKIDEIPIDQDYLSAVARNTLRKTERINIRFTAADLRSLDAHCKDPQDWPLLVEDLREIRRAVEIGVVVNVEDQQLTSFDSFYSWAHGRYHMLEDGADEWIGMD